MFGRRFGLVTTFVLALTLVVAAFGSAPTAAATYTVDTNADPATGSAANCIGSPGNCSLRDAVAAATGGDRIEFTPAVTTIVLTQQITLASTGGPITIAGPVTLSGGGATRVLFVQSATDVTLNDMTIRDGLTRGLDGGGVSNEGTLTMNRVTLTANRAQATPTAFRTPFGGSISSSGTLTLNDSLVSNSLAAESGGGIYSTGTLILNRSEVRGNSFDTSTTNDTGDLPDSFSGAGLRLSGGTAVLSDCVFADNVRDPALSSFWATYGGAIVSYGATLTINRCTFSSNIAEFGAAIYAQSSQTRIAGSTFADNQGQIAGIRGVHVAAGTFSMSHSLVRDSGVYGLTAFGAEVTVSNSTFSGHGAANLWIRSDTASTLDHITSWSAPIRLEMGGTVIRNSIVQSCDSGLGVPPDGGGNIASDASCGFTHANSRNSLDPLLGPLADNGGLTQTMLPLAGSPAIDTAIDSICASAPTSGRDQRAAVRPSGAHCDVGAVEVGAGFALNVTVAGVGGTVRSSDNLITGCTVSAGTCSTTYPASPASSIQLIATPSNGYTFSGWSGDCAGSTATISVTMNTSRACTATFTLVPFTVTTTVIDTTCNGGGNGSANAQVSGGVPPLQYLWPPFGSTSAAVYGLSAGTYTVTVTDGLGRTATAQAIVASPPPIVFSTPSSLPQAHYGASYSIAFAATGGNGGVNNYQAIMYPLPGGLSVTPAGVLSGTPTAAGSYSLRIRASDSMTCPGDSVFTLVVAPASLTVTANNASRAYAAPDPVFTASYNGFVNGDTAANLTPALTYSTNATATSSVGTYAITPAGTVGANYTPVFANGTLTITQATQQITQFAASPAVPSYSGPGDSFSVSAVGGGSTSVVVFASLTPDICVAVGTTVFIHSVGQCVLTANQAGDANHTASSQVTLSVRIVEGPPRPVPGLPAELMALLAAFMALLSAVGLREKKRRVTAK